MRRFLVPSVLLLLAGCLGKMDRGNPVDPAGTGTPPEGLAMAWFFEGNFDEVFGRNNFNNNSGVGLKAGNLGQSLVTTSYGGRALSSKAFAGDSNKGFTVNFWVLLKEIKDPGQSPAPGTFYKMVSCMDGADLAGWKFQYGDANGAGPYSVRFTVVPPGFPAAPITGIGNLPTTWFHVAGVWAPSGAGQSTAHLYINGVEKASVANSRAPLTGLSPIEVGEDTATNSGKFELDSLMVWDFPLTASQVDKVRQGILP